MSATRIEVTPAGSTAMRRTGLVLSLVVFLLVDGGCRLAGFAPYVEGLTKVGYSASLAPSIGITLLVSTILYAVPRTMVLGAILVTGYLGGATATQVRVGDPWFLFPVVSRTSNRRTARR
ncbi:MAG: DoxX family protein [Gemmatimonadales bacterium]